MKYLVAYDGSESGQLALSEAIKLTKMTQGTLTLLTVVEPMENVIYPGVSPTGEPLIDWQGATSETGKAWEENVQRVLNTQNDGLREVGESILQNGSKLCEDAGITYIAEVKVGSPRVTICHVAEEEKQDMIIIGSRGLGAIKRMLLGSVSEYVVRHAPCSVLIVRHPTED